MTLKEFAKKFIPKFLIKVYHYKLALLGAIIFGFPGKKLTVIGVTGTSGKSTTVDFITRILEQNSNRVASISSVRFKIREKEWKNELKMTMPGRFKIQKFLRQALDQKCDYAVLEVTSEGIKQYRHKFINFSAAVFTNLSPEHIESHGSFDNYKNEKIKLFKITKNLHIINIDNENAKYFLDIPARKIVTFGFNKKAYLRAENLNITDQINFRVNNTEFNLNLLGQFNAYNALAAISVANSHKISLDTCKKALEKVEGVPGRMEIVVKSPFWIIVDYAHTPEQLELAYKSFNKRNLICVLGSCGGGRDKWKRPVLGKIAKQYCSQIIITNEDPYDENPLEIMNQIASGVENKDNCQLILDRREAIKKAIRLAKPADIIMITGKGSESLMCIESGKKISWSDAKTVKEELIKMQN